MHSKQTEPEKDAGTRSKRMSRHGVRRARRPQWVGRLRHLNRALTASRRMVHEAWSAFEEVSGHATKCPVRTARKLRHLSTRLGNAANRLEHAVRALRATADAMQHAPEQIGDAPRLLTDATARWLLTMIAIEDTSREIYILHQDLAADLLSGEILPEEEGPRRLPRIPIVPHLISARDFLLCRRSSAHDRIASIRARRRRTATRPVADAPRRISRGRAPPLLSNCLL